MKLPAFKTTVLVALVAALGPAARAAERVTLSNGFALQCNHHALVEGRMRLYMDGDETNYIEIKPTDLAAVEAIPDPPNTAPANRLRTNAGDTLNQADLHSILSAAGKEHNLDVDLLASLVKAESGGNARAVSRTGARGLMQLMPATANDLGVQDTIAPIENVRGGSTYLDALLTRYHENLALALAAYNAGPAAVDRYRGIPPYRETRIYVARVVHEFNRRVKAREMQALAGDGSVDILKSPGTK